MKVPVGHKLPPTPGPFEVGDIVRMANGKMPLKVFWVSKYRKAQMVRAVYLHRMEESNRFNPSKNFLDQYSQYSTGTKSGSHERFVKYEPLEKEEEMSNNKETLYTWLSDAEVKFGYRIGTSRECKAVMEVSGTNGSITIVDPLDLEEVVPYTCVFKNFSDGNVQHYITPDDGFLSAGDAIITETGTFMILVTEDTKCKNGRNLPKFKKVQMVSPPEPKKPEEPKTPF